MLSIFRSNQVFAALPLLLYVCLAHFGALTGRVQPEVLTGQPSLLFGMLFGWTTSSPILSAWMAVGLSFLQAILINLLADRYRLLSERNWLPGMLYALASAAIPDFLFVTPALVATTFIPLVLTHIFGTYKSPNATGSLFDAGFWVGIGSLFYPPALFALVAAYAGVVIMRSFKLREQGVFFSGFFVPMFLGWLYWFWVDKGASFRSSQFGDIFSFYHFAPGLHLVTLIKWGFLLLFFIVVMLSSSGFGARKGIDAQKMMTVLIWFLAVTSLSIFLQQDPSRAHLLLAMPTVGICLAMSLADLRNRMLAEIFHLFLLGFALFIQFFPA